MCPLLPIILFLCLFIVDILIFTRLPLPPLPIELDFLVGVIADVLALYNAMCLLCINPLQPPKILQVFLFLFCLLSVLLQ